MIIVSSARVFEIVSCVVFELDETVHECCNVNHFYVECNAMHMERAILESSIKIALPSCRLL